MILDKHKSWITEIFSQQEQVRITVLRDQEEARNFQGIFVSNISAALQGIWQKFSQRWQGVEDNIIMLQTASLEFLYGRT
jgi:hypothetical protein